MSFDEQPEAHCKCCHDWEQRIFALERNLDDLSMMNADYAARERSSLARADKAEERLLFFTSTIDKVPFTERKFPTRQDMRVEIDRLQQQSNAHRDAQIAAEKLLEDMKCGACGKPARHGNCGECISDEVNRLCEQIEAAERKSAAMAKVVAEADKWEQLRSANPSDEEAFRSQVFSLGMAVLECRAAVHGKKGTISTISTLFGVPIDAYVDFIQKIQRWTDDDAMEFLKEREMMKAEITALKEQVRLHVLVLKAVAITGGA